MNRNGKDGKYDLNDLVRIAQAAFGPSIEVDMEKGKGYYVDLLANQGSLKVVRVARLCCQKSADLLAKNILALAGVKHESWTETFEGGKAFLKWETMDALIKKIRACRPGLADRVREKLAENKESAHA